ncbi:PiggyBac transposable element-derived protein 4 [Plakobranchus ocellatus]|uniref:PiggyBac transposable element-derived protein 4 n=1 Tax=Plakobranchus ocellatus TaxID=259542 RepID=A0AAV3ZAP6_9GAST|nr:PiggyBac transposable element-derived protein 4 [Plakobranchus ocellatus]
MKDLIDYGTFACRAVHSNRKHFSKDLKGQLKANEYKIRQVGNLVATWWRDKRAIHMLSTNASPVMETVSQKSKGGPIGKQILQCVEIYNKNMGGVDK